MKKTTYLISLLFGLLAANVGCDDGVNSIVQDEYQKVVLLKTSGVIDLTVYNTGSDTDYNFSVLRAGMSPELTANAALSEMNAEEFAAYCADRGLNLSIIPANCYTLSQESLNFASNERYKSIALTLHTSVINELPVSETEYVVPLILTSTDATVNTELNVLFVKPHVVIPAVQFTTPGLATQYCGSGQTTIDVPLKLQIENKWNFTCTVEVDESQIGANTLLSDGYTLADGGVVTFTEGTGEAMLKVTIDRKATDLDMNTYVLPLVVKDISLPTFDIDPRAYILGITARYPLTSSMLSTNAQELSEGPLANVLDGSVGTFFHSRWSSNGGAVEGNHYVQVTLPKTTSEFMFTYTNRSTNGSAALGEFDVLVSSNGTDFTLLRSYEKVADALPLTGAGVYKSAVLKSEVPFTSVRFVCKKNNGGGVFFVWSEFGLYTL